MLGLQVSKEHPANKLLWIDTMAMLGQAAKEILFVCAAAESDSEDEDTATADVQPEMSGLVAKRLAEMLG